MGSMPMGMPGPPPPPEQMAQMGMPAPPGAPGLAPVAKAQMAATNPHGQLFAQADAVRSVLEQMSKTEPGFAPFARQAVSAITNGLSAVASAPPPGLPEELPGVAPPGVPLA